MGIRTHRASSGLIWLEVPLTVRTAPWQTTRVELSAADPGDSPSVTHEYVSCTSPPGEGDAPLLACVDTSER